MPQNREKLLLHCCCAPCTAGSLTFLAAEPAQEIVLYFCNPNLCDKEEFDRRLDSMERLASMKNLELIVEPYSHDSWRVAVNGLEKEQEKGARCVECFRHSFSFAARMAEKVGAGAFSTTLTISPHKRSTQIAAAAAPFGNFRFIDFKKRNAFAAGNAIARGLDLYRQNFCGCEFSKR